MVRLGNIIVVLTGWIALGVALNVVVNDTAAAQQRYLGCFKDQGEPSGTGGRDLDGFVMFSPTMSLRLCTSTCRSQGFKYASTQFASWCYCGNNFGRSGPATNCDMACAGEPMDRCGGSWANSVYQLD